MDTLQQACIDKIRHFHSVAESVYGRTFTFPVITFTLRGRVAGRAALAFNEIRLNSFLLEQEKQAFIDETPGHEFAHLVAYQVFGDTGHKNGWKGVMRTFGLPPIRCHDFDTACVGRNKIKKYSYSCQCGSGKHAISTTLHNRILGGRKYKCVFCKSPLFYDGIVLT